MDAAFGDQGHSGGNNMNHLNGTLSEENGSFGNNLALEPKVRKPYTITKQRERWTDEEHQRFLDALQLHGRAWRRIEEHIGTKTAVQIRSHAQKFFSKVARGTNGNVEIPPPRPKRKPNHPYPRKQVHPYQKKIRVLEQLKDSLSLQVSSISEEENRSPTSVLSLLRSENVGAFFSNKPNRNRPPVASAAGTNEQENRIQSQMVSDEEDNKHTSLGLKSDGKRTEYESATVSGPGFEDSKKTVLTLKLFGRTVMVTEPGSSAQVIQDALQGGLLSMFYCAPSYEDAANSAAEAGMIPVPQWAFYRNLPFSVTDEQQDSAESNVQNECSGTGSNTAPERGNVCESQNGDQCSEKEVKPVVRYSSVFRNQKAATDSKSARGFVPYRKRLVKEKA